MQTTSPAGSMLSGFFHKARNPRITGGNFNQVQGDQYNYTTIVQAREEELTEFDEYYKVKRGALLKLKDIENSAYPRRWDDGDRKEWEAGKPRVDRTICTARVLEQPGMVFTVVQYSGPDARRAFEDDFRMLSRILTSTVSQIYGYSKSEIPSLIFYNELIPAAHLDRTVLGLLGQQYLFTIAKQLGCDRGREIKTHKVLVLQSTNELWLDTGRGVFCRGPPGPRSLVLLNDGLGIGDFPLTAELAQEDVLIRFLAGLKSEEVDHLVVQLLTGNLGVREQMFGRKVFQPTVFSTLTNTPIAVANNAWGSETHSLSDRKLLENGLTRFTLTHDQPSSFIQIPHLRWNGDPKHAWQTQASSVFHAHGIGLEDDLSVYELLYPYASLYFDRSRECSDIQLKHQSQQPIYLFVCQPPSDLSYWKTSSLHYWSFHEDGHLPIPHETCHSLGLSIEVHFSCSTSVSGVCRWRPSVKYKHLHQYQLLRGFNPSTTDFARHLGCDQNLYQPVSDSDWFEIQEESPPESQTSTLTYDMSGIEYTGPVHPSSVSAASEMHKEPTSYESPFFLESFSRISTESVTTAETFDMEVD